MIIIWFHWFHFMLIVLGVNPRLTKTEIFSNRQEATSVSSELPFMVMFSVFSVGIVSKAFISYSCCNHTIGVLLSIVEEFFVRQVV